MKSNTLKNKYVTIDEAISLLVGLDFVPNENTTISFLEAFVDEAETKCENNLNEKESNLQVMIDITKQRLGLAKSLSEAINTEIKAIKQDNSKSELKVMGDGAHIKITLNSLKAWSEKHFGITPLSAINHKVKFVARDHRTKLLDILDETILEFWQRSDSSSPPKNEVIKQYWKTKYPELINQPKNAYFSQKVQEVMLKIMRPASSI